MEKLIVYRVFLKCSGVWTQKNPTQRSCIGFKERRRITLPPVAVPSALTGLTSLFGMGRGETYRYNHLKSFSEPSRGTCPP